jgi:hypothetical protein
MSLKDYFSGTSCTVEIEKDLSFKKQFLDVVIIRKEDGKPPAEIPDGLENMAAHSLVSYKSLREPFDGWAADELTGHFVNYRKQVSPSLKKLLPKEDFRLYGVCTRFPAKLAKQIKFRPVKEGVYEIRWGLRDIRIIVTGRIPKEKRNALWLMFSAVQEKIAYGFSNYAGRLDEMSSIMNQMLVKYRTGGIITMSYTIEDYRKELKENVLKSLTPDDVLERFSRDEILNRFSPDEVLGRFSPDEVLGRFSPDEVLGRFSPDQVLGRFSPDELLRRISPEQRLKGLSPEEIEAYLKKLRKKSR